MWSSFGIDILKMFVAFFLASIAATYVGHYLTQWTSNLKERANHDRRLCNRYLTALNRSQAQELMDDLSNGRIGMRKFEWLDYATEMARTDSFLNQRLAQGFWNGSRGFGALNEGDGVIIYIPAL